MIWVRGFKRRPISIGLKSVESAKILAAQMISAGFLRVSVVRGSVPLGETVT